MQNYLMFLVIVLLVFGCSDNAVDLEPADNSSVAEAVSPREIGKAPNLATMYDWDVQIYSSNGERAWFSHWEPDFNMYASVYRYYDRGKTYFYYSVYENGERVEGGSGYIPNEDFQGSFAEGWFRLNTNTSEASNPDFYLDVGEGGSIEIFWQENNRWRSQWQGYYISEYLEWDYVYASTGKVNGKSAHAEGNIIGYSGSDDWSSIEKFKDSWLYFYYGD